MGGIPVALTKSMYVVLEVPRLSACCETVRPKSYLAQTRAQKNVRSPEFTTHSGLRFSLPAQFHVSTCAGERFLSNTSHGFPLVYVPILNQDSITEF